MNTKSNVLNPEIIGGKVFDKSTNHKYDRITGYNKTDLPFKYGVPVNDKKDTKKYHIIEPIQNNWEKININKYIKFDLPFTPQDVIPRRIEWKNEDKNMLKDMELFAYTIKYHNFNGRILTQEHILHNETAIPIQAAWDTGSTYTCISREFVEKYNLNVLNESSVSTPYGKVKSGEVDTIVILNNDMGFSVNAVIQDYIHEEGVDLLIGMDIISKGDFAISTYDDITCFSFRCPSQGLIDFTK